MKSVLFLAQAVFLFLVGSGLNLHGAEAAGDPVMGVYEGYWRAADGTKGRLSAQIRSVGKGQYDGFVAFYKSKILEGVLKLKPGAANFEGDTAGKNGSAMISALAGSAQITNGKLTG